MTAQERKDLLGRDKVYCNRVLFSDIEPYEVVEIKTEKTLIIREMEATMTEKGRQALNESFSAGGFCGHFDNSAQEYTYESKDDAQLVVVRLHKDGYYYSAGGGKFCLMPHPVKKYDYNF